MVSLKTIIENEWFIVCDLLPSDGFIKFCRSRGINTSREQLEQLEKLKLLYPIARVRFPNVTIKFEYSEDRRTYRYLGVLEEGEAWSGETREDYAAFSFTRREAEDWLKNGWLWDPQSRDFESWSGFLEKGEPRVESYYSMFQCLPLHQLCQDLRIHVGAEWWSTYSLDQIHQTADRMTEIAHTMIDAIQRNGCRGDSVVVICQAISNRYYPKTQSDRRTLWVSYRWPYHDWRWDEYCSRWDAEATRGLLGISVEEIKNFQARTALDASWLDPLENWYRLIRFISVEQRGQLKGKALLAQTLYEMEEMLRLFYHDLTAERLYAPDESPSWTPSDFYGEGVPEDELQYLEFLTNQYHLNPRPRLLLFVEGPGERQQFPRIARELLGYPMERVGIQVETLWGITEAGKLERLIDHYHYRQTIVYLILDNENNSRQLRKKLLNTKSSYPEVSGVITKPELIFLWEKCFEFDNFSDEEIAGAMTKVSGNRYTFATEEVAQARAKFGQQKSPLSILYSRKLNYDLNKPKLAEELVREILKNPEKECDSEGKLKRPITAKVWEIIQLARSNYQPVRLEDWRSTQKGGFLRGANRGSSAPENPAGNQ